MHLPLDYLRSQANHEQSSSCVHAKGAGDLRLAKRLDRRKWRLIDQIRLRTVRNTRQARRKERRMQASADRQFASAMDWFTTVLAIESYQSHCGVHHHSKAPADADDDDDEPPISHSGRRSQAAGGKRARQSADSARQTTKKQKVEGGSGGDGDDYGDGDDSSDDSSDDESDHGGDPEDGGEDKKGHSKSRLPNPKHRSLEKRETKDDGSLASEIEAVLKLNDPQMKNTLRMARKFRNLQLKPYLKAVSQTDAEMPLLSYLAGPKANNRDYHPHSRSRSNLQKGSSHWIFFFRHGNGNNPVPGTSFVVDDRALPSDASQTDQEALHNELARMYNAWPFEIKGVAQPIQQMMLVCAARNVFAAPHQVKEVAHHNTLSYKTRVNYIDPTGGACKQIDVTMTATDSNMKKVAVPALPALRIIKLDGSMTQIAAGESYHIDTPDLSKSKVTREATKQKSSQHSQYRAEDAVYYIASQLQGLVASEARMKQLLTIYRQQIGLQKGAGVESGLYGGKADLYSLSYRKSVTSTIVQPTKRVADDLGFPRAQLNLNIFSLNASRALPVLDTIVQQFCGGAELPRVWLEAAKTADGVNIEIKDKIPPSSRCDCDDTAAEKEMHACEGCSKPVLCKTRRWDSMGRLVCGVCLVRDQTSAFGGRRPGETLAASLAHRSLERNFRRECERSGRNADLQKYKAIFQRAWLGLKDRLPGRGDSNSVSDEMKSKYTDDWTGLKFEVGGERGLQGNNPSVRRVIPHGITIDTIHRQGRPENDSLRHTDGNLAITSNVCQYGKGSFNPGVLHEIGEFKRRKPEEQALDIYRKALVEKCTEMAVVSCKRAHINAGTGSVQQKYDKICAEQIAGRPYPNEPGPWDKQARGFVGKPVPAYVPDGENLWDDDTWMRTQQCAQSTADYFGVKLYKLPADGTLWIGKDYSTPRNFDRNGIFMLCRERLQTMRLHCNKKWETVDIEETLYQEMVFQHCCSATSKPELKDLKEKYGDRLGLPLVIWKHTPLRLSVAHRHHGFGMSSGWSDVGPRDVQERLDNDSQNNMLMESWYINSSKQDMAEHEDQQYETMDMILQAARVADTGIYNPAKVFPPSYADPNRLELEEGDEYLGAGFNDLDVDDPEADDTGKTRDFGAVPEDDGGAGPSGTAAPKAVLAEQEEEAADTEMPDVTGREVSTAREPETEQDMALRAVLEAITSQESTRVLLVEKQYWQRLVGNARRCADDDDIDTFNLCIDELWKLVEDALKRA